MFLLVLLMYAVWFAGVTYVAYGALVEKGWI